MTDFANWVATGPPAVVSRPLYGRVEWALWVARGRRGRIPHRFKEQLLRDTARKHGLEVLVETGTYMGDMVWALRRDFREIHSIELDPALFERAKRRLAGLPNVHLHHGDSGVVLGEVVAGLREPALFWLDGHYSGGVTARADSDTPIEKELTHVYSDRGASHVVLIDDAGDFGTQPAYPTVEELERSLQRLRPGLAVRVENGIIRVGTPG